MKIAEDLFLLLVVELFAPQDSEMKSINKSQLYLQGFY